MSQSGYSFSIVRPACVAFALAAAAMAAPVAEAQSTSVKADRVQCVPAGANAVIQATVSDNRPDTTTRLFFRRMNDVVEDLYYVDMYPEGGDRYWGVMPKAEKRRLDRHEIERRRDETAANSPEAVWWREKEASEHRNPNQDLDPDEIQERASVGKIRATRLDEHPDRPGVRGLARHVGVRTCRVLRRGVRADGRADREDRR